jgi:hypothetical protein
LIVSCLKFFGYSKKSFLWINSQKKAILELFGIGLFATWVKEELKSREFKKANKRILIHHIPIFGTKSGSFAPCSDLWIPVLEKGPFNVSLNAHTHRFQVIEKGVARNNFPVIIGGGNKDADGTVMVVEKKGDKLMLEVLNADGVKLLDKEL